MPLTPTATGDTVAHRIQCAAITRGCTSYLTWTDHTPAAELTATDRQRLTDNGWRQDDGLWVCGDDHPPA